MSFRQSKLVDQWNEFTPGTATPDLLNPAQYTPIGTTPPSECENGPNVCAIKTPEGQSLTAEYLQNLNDQGHMSGPAANDNVRFKF